MVEKLDLDVAERIARREKCPNQLALIARIRELEAATTSEPAHVIELLLDAGFIDAHKVDQARAIAAWNKRAAPANHTVPDWQPIETAPNNIPLLVAVELDGPGDWRIKIGGLQQGHWRIFGASWTPSHWMPLPAAPIAATPQDRGAER